jgi:hypothetical protein
MIAQISLIIRYNDNYYYDADYDRYQIWLCVVNILLSIAAGVSLTFWCFKVRQVSLTTTINRYQQV